MRSIRKSVIESDDDATRSSSGGGSSTAPKQPQQIDLSLLRKPILTAVTGFLEAHRAYEAGTEEIRKLLASECDVLYECRVCRNIFRSLTNFISHKRVYCRKLFNAAKHFHFQNDGFLDQDLSTILQAEQDSQRKAKKIHADILNRDLSSIIERLRRKQHQLSASSQPSADTDYYDKLNHKLTQDDLNRQHHVLQLDRVPTSQTAVYQTVRVGTVDNMRTQVGELESLKNNNNNNTVLGPDGKVLESPLSRPQSTLPVIRRPSEQYFKPIELERGEDTDCANVSAEKSTAYSCPECNVQFDTEKMLKLHTDLKHTPSTYVYTCPSCSRTFMQPAAVIRHLCNDHKKSMRRIKMMRDSILKRRVRIDEVVVKGPSREVSRLLQAASSSSSSSTTNGGSTSGSASSSQQQQQPQQELNGLMMDHDEADATRAWMENLEHFDQGPMCSYCGKTFDRKAVLSTHMQTCVQRIRQTENGSVPPTTSGRKSKVKEEAAAAAAAASVLTKVKQEPVDPAASDDSNSYDVPLSTLQARINQEGKNGSGQTAESSELGSSTAVTVKPEELRLHEEQESSNRRKRKKPPIMLRNASDDISWEVDEADQSSIGDSANGVAVQIKQEPVEQDADTEFLKPKKAPRNRKKKPDDKDELNDQEMVEKIEQEGEIVCRCSKKYSDPEKYKRHLRVFHSRQRRFWCSLCDFKGYRKVDTINHLMQEHGYKGDAEDISCLINFQPVEKIDKRSSVELPCEPVTSIIEAVSRSCDTSTTDISFVESSITETVTIDTKVARSGQTDDRVPTPEPYPARKRVRATRATRESISLQHPLDDPPLKPKPIEVEEETPSPTSKRPIRNRVKPVNKDFVYDLTHLLHTEEDLDDFPLPELVLDKPSPPSKPKSSDSSRIPTTLTTTTATPNSSSSSSSTPDKRPETKRESLRSHASKSKPPSIPPHLFRGSAFQMAKRQVELGLAAFHRPPDIPHERTFVPSKLSPQKHPHPQQQPSPPKRRITTIHDWPVVKKERQIGSIAKHESDIQIKRKYTKRASAMADTLLPELIREKRRAIPRRNSVISLPQKLSASLEILNKLNASRSAAGLDLVRVRDIPASMLQCSPTSAPSTETDFRRLIEANLKDHRATMSQVNVNGITVDSDVGVGGGESASSSPRKRITLMQRLQENRSKRLQEQNGTSSSKDKQPTLAPPPPPPSDESSSSGASKSTTTTGNIADMLQAKMKGFSSF